MTPEYTTGRIKDYKPINAPNAATADLLLLFKLMDDPHCVNNASQGPVDPPDSSLATRSHRHNQGINPAAALWLLFICSASVIN